MKNLKVKKLNVEDFRLFGNYISIKEDVFSEEEYDSDWTFELYRGDNMTMSLGKTNTVAGFSFGFLKKRKMVIKSLQAHCHTEKTILMDKDCVLAVAPLSVGNIIGEDKIQAFMVPSGTMVKLSFCTWYTIPFPVDDSECMYIQCEALRTYNHDTKYYELSEIVEVLP